MGPAVSLDVENLVRSYGTNIVLSSVSLSFPPGRLAALVGPNGAGKTTLLRIAAGLIAADSGTVRGPRCLYYGGFDCLPIRGTENAFRLSLGLSPIPDGRKTLGKLSRGQLHLVGLRAALDLREPALLLDEPWTALEPDARERLNERLVERARQGGVVVCSTHDLDEVGRIADDVVFLRDGTATVNRREEQAGLEFRREKLLDLFRTRRVA